MSGFCQLQLTCTNKAEADLIISRLLDDNLIACAKQIPLTAAFKWKGKFARENETLLLMESREELFDEVEQVVASLHTYDTFVLTATPIMRVSKKAEDWLNESLKHG